jgi:TrmH family RNA methyltransferase
MLSKNEVKYIQSLCHKKSRDEEGVFIAEGPKMIQELISNKFEIIDGFATKDWLEKNNDQVISFREVSSSELERISTLTTPNNVLVVAKKRTQIPEPIIQNTLTIVLDGIQDPGNLGTIVRIADWFGITQIVASETSADVYNPKVVQATMGSICRVNIWYKPLNSWLKDITIPVYGALLEGRSIYETDKVKEGILIIGNESRGISEELISMISQPITIPKRGGADSLNAAVATGIILSHIAR